jgi:hypothetical protein
MADECLSSDQKSYVDKSIEVARAEHQGDMKAINATILGMDRAAILKAEEIDRRLAEHNELRKEVITDRSTLLSQERYGADQKSFKEWKERTDKRLTELSTNETNKLTKTNWIAIGVLGLAVLNIIIVFINLYK